MTGRSISGNAGARCSGETHLVTCSVVHTLEVMAEEAVRELQVSWSRSRIRSPIGSPPAFLA
jgi:hypothetical protein